LNHQRADGRTGLRRRLQWLVDRRFNRARYDADRMVDAFASRLQDAVDLDTVWADLAAVVRGALEPAQVSVWISGGGAVTGHVSAPRQFRLASPATAVVLAGW